MVVVVVAGVVVVVVGLVVIAGVVVVVGSVAAVSADRTVGVDAVPSPSLEQLTSKATVSAPKQIRIFLDPV